MDEETRNAKTAAALLMVAIGEATGVYARLVKALVEADLVPTEDDAESVLLTLEEWADAR